MTRTEIEEKVRDFMIEDMEIAEEKVHANALLKEDMGIDSLDYVDIIVIVNRIFGFKIKLEEMTNVKTLGDFCDYIEQKIKE
jgi:acyl carrier protein